MNGRIQRRVRRRGVSLVEVLIVVAIMGVIAGAVTLVAIPEHNRARVRVASIGADTIKQAVSAWRATEDGAAADHCPTVADLVNAKKLDAKKTDDPWGSVYRIVCEGDEVHVISPGRDRKPNTQDDIPEGLKPADLETVVKL
ncbi:MAG: prepilin-type N-terminal cleavage/methylation domain-containing protein [Minicystis sp.]